MALKWSKTNIQNKTEKDQFIQFSQLKRNSKTKKTQYLAIYNDRIQYFKDPDYKILHGEILFSSSLTLEWLYLGQIKSEGAFPPLIGFKLQKENEPLSFYIQKENTLHKIQKLLSKFILQKNIHYYYKLVRKIGKGGFASVYLVQNIMEDKFYAAKVFLKQKQKSKENQLSIKKEIAALRLINHQNMLNLKEAFITENSIYIITDYYSGPTLESYLKQNDYSLTKQQIRKLIKQQLEGLQYLHSLGIMHRDIKPSNILFTSNECQNLVIADFGLAQEVASGNYLFPRAGTPGYVAPEVANNIEKLSNYSELCDLFSMGCILYLMATGNKLFEGKKLQEILAANKKCQIDFESEQFSKIDSEIKEVLVALLVKNPEERMSAKEILQLALFTQKQTKLFTKDLIDTSFSKSNSPESMDLFVKLKKVDIIGEKYQLNNFKEDQIIEEKSSFTKQFLKSPSIVEELNNFSIKS